MRLKYILPLLIVVGCTSTTSQSINLFFEATERPLPSNSLIKADSLFNYSIPVVTKKDPQFVYVLDSGCSFCISNAIDCYKAYQRTRTESSFIFLLKSNNTDIFLHYLKEEYDSIPKYYCAVDCQTLKDGLYTVKNGYISAYSAWEYK